MSAPKNIRRFLSPTESPRCDCERLRLSRWIKAFTIALVVLSFIGTQPTNAEDLWEYSPYRVQLWVVFENNVELTDQLKQSMTRYVVEKSEAVIGSPWDLTVASPPPDLEFDLAMRLDVLTEENLLGKLKPPPAKKATAAEKAAAETSERLTQLKEVLREDKIEVISVQVVGGQYRVLTREFDCRARRWGTCHEQTVASLEVIPEVAFTNMLQGFAPLARLEKSNKDKSVYYRLRAAGLAVQEVSPVLIEKETVLRPFTRYNDRVGQPRPGGITAVPWTFAIVTERDVGRLKCEVQSGMPSPLSGRANPRIDRFALAVRYAEGNTVVRFRTTDKNPQPMSGYDVYAKDPRSEKVEHLGRTDWRGSVEVEPDEFPIRLIYVRNGGQLLARVPIIPGLEREKVVDLNSDDRRIQAEGFLTGVQSSIMDLLVSRELLVTRIRKNIDEKKFDEAKKLLDEFQALETRDELSKLVDQQQIRIVSPHKNVQSKITKLFDDTRRLLLKFVDPDQGNRLANELELAKQGKSIPRETVKKTPAATPQ